MLDVVGFNYADSRYELDAELFPHRVIVGSETFPEQIDVMWELVSRLPHVIGDFTWTGWDYLGEAGIGRVDYTDAEGYVPDRHGRALPVPARRVRRHRHHRAPPPDLVLPRDRVRPAHRRRTSRCTAPQHHGRPTATTPWSWDDTVSSWSWDVPRARRSRSTCTPTPTRSSCSSTACRSAWRASASEKAFRARFETEYRPGRARRRRPHRWRGDRPAHAAHGRGAVALAARAEDARDRRTTVSASSRSRSRTRREPSPSDADRLVTVTVEGRACSPVSAPAGPAPRSRSRVRRSRPTTGARSRSFGRRAREPSP